MNSLKAKSLQMGILALTIGLMTVATAAPERQRARKLDRTTSLATFERIKKLDGTWRSQSTKGWEERQQFRVISRGTAVASQSIPGPAASSKPVNAPDAPMLTVFHMDGGRLLLTHYCEAGNQPRMIAASIENGGRSVRFAFLDATNLTSPAAGHMHSVVMTFVDDDHFSERWSWYENGREKWMETVHNERVAPVSQRL